MYLLKKQRKTSKNVIEFKNNEDEVIKILEQLKLKIKEYEWKKNQLLKSADVKFNWAIGLALIPVVNVIAGLILYMKGSENIENAIVESKEELLMIAATETIKGPLIMSVTNLVNTFHYIAKFFIALTDEFDSIDDDDKLKTMHYNRMRVKSLEIIKACCYKKKQYKLQSFYLYIQLILSIKFNNINI